MSKKFPEDYRPISSYRMYNDTIDNYWFYHKDSDPVNEPLLYKELLNSANNKIEVWDPWVNTCQNEFEIFNSIKENITVKFLTLKKLNKPCNSNYLSEIETEFKNAVSHLTNVRLGIRVINESDPSNNENWFFHDRFLIIDRQKVYLIGSSIGWHTKSIGSTGIYKIQGSETIEFIIAIFDEFWNHWNSLTGVEFVVKSI